MNHFLISTPGFSELLIAALVIAMLIFWISCIVDIARSNFDSSTTKIVWLLVVIFLGILGALIYNFAGKPTRSKAY